MKNKVLLICCYFGKLPNYFQLWLDSCKANPDFDWIIVTDDDRKFEYPSNVIKILYELEKFALYIKSKLDFEANIPNAYKLCDFKVLYGVIFSEYLKDYTHWGHCDLDVIWGKINLFVTDDILDKYDRLFEHGHLSIYKNNSKVNNLYKLSSSGLNYKTILSNPAHFGFDEFKGMNLICKENNILVYDKIVCADINFYHYSILINNRDNYKKQFFQYCKGHIYSCTPEQNFIEEFAYIHLQKRPMKYKDNVKFNEEYLIMEDRFDTSYSDTKKYLVGLKFSINAHMKSISIKIRWNFYWRALWLYRSKKH